MMWSPKSLINTILLRPSLLWVLFALWLWLLPSIVSAAELPPLQHGVVTTAQKYTYVRERRANSGPEIDRWLGYLGLPPGNPYCAAFTIGCYYEAAQALNIKQPLPKIGRVSMLWASAKKNPYKFQTFHSSRVKQGIEKVEPADIPIWSHNKLPGNSNWNGHTGIVLRQLSTNSFVSVEGNTSSGVAGSQREGDGVFVRTRALGIGTKFPVEGFIRVK